MAIRNALVLLISLASVNVVDAAMFEARSKHYVLSVEASEGRNSVLAGYTVRVTSLDTKATLFSETALAPVEITREVGDLHIVVRLSQVQEALRADLEVEQGDMLIDSMQAIWMLAPRRAHVHAPGAMRVGGDVKAPVVLHRVEPEYTEEGRKARASGVTILEVLIDKTGTVKDAIVLKPLPFGLSDSALAAVRQWTFEPGTLNGQPVDVVFNLTVNFKLETPPLPR